MKFRYLLFFLSLLSTCSSAIELKGFTSNIQPFTNIEVIERKGHSVTIYNINVSDEVNKALFGDLDLSFESEEDAFNYFNERVSKEEASIKSASANALVPLTYIMTRTIDRYPAVIIEDCCVIYGVTSMSEVLRRYEAWLEK